MSNEQIMQSLQAMPPAQREQMMQLMKTIGSQPESLFNMFERLEIPWEKRRTKEGDIAIIIKWDDFMAGERRNQDQGSILKRLMEQNPTGVKELELIDEVEDEL